MNITRHNYEELFILYLDNELTAAERQRVEDFAASNPDLKAELDLLLQTRLTADTSITFDSKDTLLYSASQKIDAGNYEEWFLSYTDNELTADERKAVEEFVAANPVTGKELQALQLAKFQPETAIVFPDKSTLYRKEEKAKGIVLSWKRVAAAAAILLVAGTSAFMLLSRNEATEDASIASGTVKPPASVTTSTGPDTGNDVTSKTTSTASSTKNDMVPATADKNKEVTSNDKTVVPSKKTVDPVTIVPVNEEPVKESLVKHNNNLPQPTHNPNVNPSIEETQAYAKLDAPVREGLTNSKQINQLPLVTPVNAEPSLIRHQITETTADDDISYAAEPVKKNKLRGFFRKVTRTFEKTTNIKATDEDDRLLIGGLAIRL